MKSKSEEPVPKKPEVMAPIFSMPVRTSSAPRRTPSYKEEDSEITVLDVSSTSTQIDSRDGPITSTQISTFKGDAAISDLSMLSQITPISVDIGGPSNKGPSFSSASKFSANKHSLNSPVSNLTNLMSSKLKTESPLTSNKRKLNRVSPENNLHRNSLKKERIEEICLSSDTENSPTIEEVVTTDSNKRPSLNVDSDSDFDDFDMNKVSKLLWFFYYFLINVSENN